MVITKEKAIEMLKLGRIMCETTWGGYKYRIDNCTVRFPTARKLMKSGLVAEDKERNKSPLLRWFRWAESLPE